MKLGFEHEALGFAGVGVMHIVEGHSWIYSLEGLWELKLLPDILQPASSSQQVTVQGHAALTKVSQCTLKVDLWNVSFSDWQSDVGGVLETWVLVSGGRIMAVCGQEGDIPHQVAYLHSLSRSVVSAALNVVPELNNQILTTSEGDHYGQCATQYQVSQVWPGGHEVVRKRDLAACVHWQAGVKQLSVLTNNATWRCHQQYAEKDGVVGQTLQQVMCQQTVILPSVAAMNSVLSLSLLQTRPSRPLLNHNIGLLRELDLEVELQSTLPVLDHNLRAYNLLNQTCEELSQRVTSRAAVLYPDLVEALKHLQQGRLVQLYEEINSGKLCPAHHRLRGVFSGALRDSSSPSAAAAKCSLMISGVASFSHTWALSLANVKHPTVEALTTCSGLLADEHWETSAVLGVAAMAGQAACEDGDDCSVGKAARVVTNYLSRRLTRCSVQEGYHQILQAIRGLGNIRNYGWEVEAGLQTCGEDEHAVVSVRVAAITALGRGPCSTQVVNWLKWKVLNETLLTELRITAFQSLWRCSTREAKAVAILITRRDSHVQVKSYVSAFLDEDEGGRDVRQFSRHLVANLSALLGLPDTHLHTDIIFDNSFLPRSISFNLSSVLLKHIGNNVQVGGRLENLEDLLQAIFGPKGMAGRGIEGWIAALVRKGQQIFTSATQDFVQNHERSKRSFSTSEVADVLARVRHDVVTELRGWVSASLGDQERLFFPYAVDPLALDWEGMVTSWIDHIFETTYSSLLNSNVETTTGWAEVEESMWVWSVLGTPVKVWQQEGGLVSLTASSQVSLLSLLTNPRASTLNIGLGPSMGVYSRLGISVNSLPGQVTAASTTQAAAAIDVSALLAFQGGDSVDLTVDIPNSFFHGYTMQVNCSLVYSYGDNGNHGKSDPYTDDENHGSANMVEDEEDSGCLNEDGTDGSANGQDFRVLLTRRSCQRGLETALGIKLGQVKQWVVGQQWAGVMSHGYLRKSEGITGYRMGFSWKNPGRRSFFLDVSIEAEGSNQEHRAGLVFGLTYSPHFTFKVQLHSKQYTAFAEASLVNDPNMKRIEGHIGYQRIRYGLKAELLMVKDGGHTSVKPRLVVAYPGQQEDALLEGYLAFYLTDKVTSITVDLYTEGSLKAYLDIAVKGTAEMKQTLGGFKVITLKNIEVSTQHLAVGLEATLSLMDNGLDGRVQVMWGGQMAVVEGNVTGLSWERGAGEDQEYQVNFQFLLPSHPHLNTRVLCNSHVLGSQVFNNLTLVMGSEASLREFQVIHSTSWSIGEAGTTPDSRLLELIPHHRSLAFKVINKLLIVSPGTDIEWKVNHVLEMTDKCLENLITANTSKEHYKIMANFYDQSEVLFKYYIELELNLASWYFSYTDTLEQQANGEVLGYSTTIMPSNRIYTSSSKYLMKVEDSKFIVDLRLDVLVQDGSHSWNISGQELLEWSASEVSLKTSVKSGLVEVFGLVASVEGLNVPLLNFHFKNWAKDLYECEAYVGSEDGNTSISFNLLVIPLNQEIISRVAVDHYEQTGGKVDGELSWDARRDPSRTLTLSSTLQLPKVGSPIMISGTLSLLQWTWRTSLVVELGEEIGSTNKITFFIILPDESRFETGSQLDFSFDQNSMFMLTNFYLHLPVGEIHNSSLLARGVLNAELSEATLGLSVDSPITQEILFIAQVKKEETEDMNTVDLKLQTNSGAGYWTSFAAEARSEWDGNKIDAEAEVDWGDLALVLNTSGSYVIVEEQHQLEASAELKIPSSFSWKHLKSSIAGTFSMGQNPARFKVTQNALVEKDNVVIFSTRGQAAVRMPEVQGDLTITHAGEYASEQIYNLDGRFTGQEVEVRIAGTIDGVPVRALVHYVDGQQVRIYVTYHSEDHFSLALTTQLQDFSIGIRRNMRPSSSLATGGQLVVLGQHTKIDHRLSISASHVSSALKLSPIQGKVLLLETSRTKLGHNHWCTDINLIWGQDIFTYKDEISIPSLSGMSLKVQMNAPVLHLRGVVVVVEAEEEHKGRHTVNLVLQQLNSTIHSARVMFYTYDTGGEKILQAGVQDVIFNKCAYQDMLLYHAIIPLTSGLEVKSNMTVGEIPLVAVGVKVTPDARALMLVLCTTDEECIKVQAHAMVKTTPSTRAFSMTAHTLNSLVWKNPEDPLVQNCVTLQAEETAERMLVSGGVKRLECEEVRCENSTTKGLLHTTLQLTHDTMDVMVNTTRRTVALTSVLRESEQGETPQTALPGGLLNHSTTLENQLWLDKEREPLGVIKWTTILATYVSSRATELALHSSLHHPSLNKDLEVQGYILVGPDSTISFTAVLDVFSIREDSLQVEIELVQEGGRYILQSSLAKAMCTMQHLIDVTVIMVPSPDSGQVSLVVVFPDHSPKQPPFSSPGTPSSDLNFSLACGLNNSYSHRKIACKLTMPSVYEEMSVGYQRWEASECLGGTASLLLLNHTYQFLHNSCHDPTSLQTSLSRKIEGRTKEDLSLKFGLVDVHLAEIDLLSAASVRVQLHPPFLLHVSAHHSKSLWTQWQHIKTNVHDEIENMTTIAKSVVRDMVADLSKVDSLSSVVGSTPASSLGQYLHTQVCLLLQEVEEDQLLQDIVYGVQASIDITSIFIEAVIEYISHNFRETFHGAVVRIKRWLEVAVMNIGSGIMELVSCIQHTLSTTFAFITESPQVLLDQVLKVPIINEAVNWGIAQVQLIQKSTLFTIIRDFVTFTTKLLHKVLSRLYSKDEESFHRTQNEQVWNIWIPLDECGHSLFEVWQRFTTTSHWDSHKEYLTSAFLYWWHLLTHPAELLHHLSPPFSGEAAIIGDNNFLTVDGSTFSLAPSCGHILLTDSQNQLFTLLSHQHEAGTGTNYTLLLGNTVISVQSDLQVTLNNATINLPHVSRRLSVVRRLHQLVVTARDAAGRELVTLTCWSSQQACVVGMSGWLHGDTRGLLGNLNQNPADDFMRPSGKVALSRDIFSESWRLGSECVPERDGPEPAPHPRTQLLCSKFLLHYTAPVFACHETVDITPFYNICLRYLTKVQNSIHETQVKEDRGSSVNIMETDRVDATTQPLSTSSNPASSNLSQEVTSLTTSNSTVYEISIKDVLFQLTDEKSALTGVSLREASVMCDVAAAYSTTCGRHNIDLALPSLCEKGKQLTYEEPLSPQPQLDLVLLIDEESCDAFMYQNLIRPLPQVLRRVAQGKNISDIQIGVLGYGSGGGEVVYRTRGTTLLTPASELRVTKPPQKQRSQASPLEGMRAISKFPFRAGSVRVALALRCDARDIPKFTETLPREMQRRRLVLFTLTPDHLVFNSRHPKAVRNTIGIDRWRVYNMRLDRQHSLDSWGIRAPSSNIAQLAMKSGGGVFSVSALRKENRARYYMKIFRRVLSKAIIKVVENAYKQKLQLK